MLKHLLCFAVALITVQATGDFVVLHSPDSVVFKGNEEVEQSLLKEVFAAAVGCTVNPQKSWSGMTITNPFGLPEAVVAVALEGIESIDVPKGERFPLHVNEVEETTWQALRERLEERNNDNTLVRFSLGDGLDALGQSALGELKPIPIDEGSLKALSLKKEEDKKCVEEVQLLHAIASRVGNVRPDCKPDVYWLVMSGMRPVYDVHGHNSSAAREARHLLNNALHAVSEAFIQAYEGQVIIAAFTNDASQVRHSRSVVLNRQSRDAPGEPQDDGEGENNKIEEDEDTKTNTDITSESNSGVDTSTADNDILDDSEEGENSDKEHSIHTKTKDTGQIKNLAKNYTDNYPVIFNIMLWFGVAFFFSLLAICIAIAQMDPGRDSIIYRMTSNRMKKDN